nr:MAG TPA: hypothetical protein [Caudoviricetes sp.]
MKFKSGNSSLKSNREYKSSLLFPLIYYQISVQNSN